MNPIKTLLKKYRLLLVIGGFLLGGYYWLTNLVSIEAISAVPQATVIRARNGEELFRFFEEDRRWIEYGNISPRMTKAIIATEDKSFRENNGTDMSSLGRAVWNNIKSLRSDVPMQGGSTITQQLIKNVFLTNKKTISRKFQELVLARYLTTTWTDRMQDDFQLGRNQAFQKAKEEILAAYLNVVYFGNRSYGIESAAQNYFGKSAKELSILESSILASLPQAPSIYNPSQDPRQVLGYWNIYSGENISEGLLFQTGAASIISQLEQKSFAPGQDCLNALENWATISSLPMRAIYQKGRKDWVLCRMYELNMIDANTLKQSFLDAKSLQLQIPRFPIKAPHFVFRLQKYLLDLPAFAGYDEQSLARAGLDITTTLDLGKQQQAEDAIANYMGSLRRLGANNRSMLHINPENAEVLSYVGSADFFDTTILGQNDMIQAKRQIGSTIKPFFYGYLFDHYPLAIDASIVDAPLQGAESPRNNDNQFWGKISMAQALASSRNLPVVRIFLALGGDKIFVPFLRSLGMDIDVEKKYGYALALGAEEITMMELAQAYLQLASTGSSLPKIQPLLRISSVGKGREVENLTQKQKRYISLTATDMIWKMLSNASYMPSSWYWLHNLPLQHFALKTGTTDKKIGKMTYPRDGWSVVYNAHDLLLSWAGNTNGDAMHADAFGGEINHYVVRQYLNNLIASGSLIDEERVVDTQYSTGSWYQFAQHHEVDKDVAGWLWRFQGEIPRPITGELETEVVIKASDAVIMSGDGQKSGVIRVLQ